jgi:hypothetical protein
MSLAAEPGPDVASLVSMRLQKDRASVERNPERPIQKQRVTQGQGVSADPKFALNRIMRISHEFNDFAAYAKAETAEREAFQEVRDR